MTAAIVGAALPLRDGSASPHNGDYDVAPPLGGTSIIAAAVADAGHPADTPPAAWGAGAPSVGATLSATVVTDYLTAHLGSPNTYAAYRSDLADFNTFCRARHREPLEATRADVVAYVHDLQQAGRSPATVARRLVVLRGFYDLAVLDYGLPASPVARIRYPRPRSHRRLPSLTVAELHAFLQAADADSRRTSGLAWLLATTGLRISEACGALVDDVTQRDTEPWLDVVCKGGLRRSVPLHHETWQRLEPLLLRRPGPIFATRTGAELDRRAASRTLVRIATQAGIHHRFSPHVLRHTFVTLARATGCPLEDVQEAAGHADPATTRSYDRTLLTHAAHPAHRILQALDPAPAGNGIGGGVREPDDSCPT